MSTVVIQENIRIPNHVDDLDSFCQWVCSEEYAERGRFSFLNGEVWVDMSPERLYSHNQVKTEYTSVLHRLTKRRRLGRFCQDRMLLRNDAAGLSTEPDGAFFSWKSLRSGRVKVINVAQGYDILLGTPDMALEVVSDTSEVKDTEILPLLYWKAGIPEFWLVDARGERPRFDIFRHTRKGYVAASKQAGWVKSTVFGKSLRLTVQPDELGAPEYTLSVR